MGRRTWVKIYCDKWIEGTIRQESAALRGVWTDLLALCGSGEYSDLGEIKVRNDIGFTDLQFQKALNLSRKEWLTIKKRLTETQRIHQNSDNILTIINWKMYQSEYERQKPQRIKSANDSAGKSADESAGRDNRVEILDNRLRDDRDNRVNSATRDLNNFLEELKIEYPDLDVKKEWKKCQDWWSEGKKKMYRPKTALRNWLEKAMKIREEQTPRREPTTESTEIIIAGQTVEKIRRILKGEIEASQRNKEHYRSEMERLGIPLEE